jgi:predicted Zn-dependent protease
VHHDVRPVLERAQQGRRRESAVDYQRQVAGVRDIGNGPDVLSKVTMTGNDFAFSDGRWTCGKEQTVPVNVGLPTVKVSEITIGGSDLA